MESDPHHLMQVTRSAALELVAACLDEYDRGGPSAVEELLAQHPELADEVRKRLGVLRDAGLLDEPSADEPGFPERLGNFRLIERLGSGGMGVVYLAEQEDLGRRVALKLIRPDLLYFDKARERFRREVEVVAQLKHPGIVPIYTVGEEDGIPFYAMEKVEGCSLDEVVRSLRGADPSALTGADLLATVGGDPDTVTLETGRPFATASWIDACTSLLLQLARVLEHAHAHGVLHRDLKPSNIMLAPGARVMLLDFGLASTRGTSKLTRTGSQVGSLPYMAPEQLRSQAVDERTDIYALGVTFYELLTLRLPYYASDPEETRRRVLTGSPRAPHEENASIEWDAETVCLTALERDRARRYTSARDLAEDLRAVLQRRPIRARRPGRLLRARRMAQRHPASAVGVGLGLLLLVGSIGFGLRESQTSRALARALEEKDAALVDARAGLRRALSATNEMLRAGGEVGRRDRPPTDELRRELVTSATGLYDALLGDYPDDPEVCRDAARGFGYQAMILTDVGELEGAEAALSRSLALLERLGQEDGLDLLELDALANSTRQLGTLLVAREEIARAAVAFERTVTLRRRCLAALELRGVDDEALRTTRAALFAELNDVGATLAISRRFDQAESALRELRERLYGALERDPDSIDMRRALMVCLDALSSVTSELARHAESEELGREALATCRELIARQPDELAFRTHLARVLMNHGATLLQRGSLEAAEEAFQESVQVYDEIVREHPALVDQRAHRLAALRYSAEVHLERGRLEAAGEVLDQALELADELALQFPDLPLANQALVDVLTSMGAHLLRVDEPEQAEELLRAALEKAEALCARWPESCEQGTHRLIPLTPLCEALLAQERLDEARALAERTRDQMAAEVHLAPDREYDLSEHLVVLARIAVDQADRELAAQACRELTKLRASPRDYRAAARLLVAGRTELDVNTSDLALDLLTLSLDARDGAVEELSATEDFRALWEHPRFEQLVQRSAESI